MSSIWQKDLTLKELNQFGKACSVEYLGIQFIQKTDHSISATMPVNLKTQQPLGLFHGGMHVVLAETVASLAGFCCVGSHQAVVGLEVNASYLKAVKEGEVTACASPIRLGRRVQVWNVDIHNQQQELCCVVRINLMVVEQ